MFDRDDWGAKIKAYRIRNAMTQEALGYELGVGGATVSRWERGRDKPNLSVQKRIAKLVMPPALIGNIGLVDVINETGDIAVLMDKDYRMVRASKAHRDLLGYDLTDIMGKQYPMWTEAMFKTMEPLGGPEGWWRNGVRKMTFNIMRKPHERAKNPVPIYQRVTTVTVSDGTTPYRFAITRTIPESQFAYGPPQIDYF